jgi:hypothetical protein
LEIDQPGLRYQIRQNHEEEGKKIQNADSLYGQEADDPGRRSSQVVGKNEGILIEEMSLFITYRLEMGIITQLFSGT